MTKEQKDLAEAIAKANGGCVMFNLAQASKIAERNRDNFTHWLHINGILVQSDGKSKYVNVNDLAVAMSTDK